MTPTERKRRSRLLKKLNKKEKIMNYQQDLQKMCSRLSNIRVDKHLSFTGRFFYLEISFWFDGEVWHMNAVNPDREDFFENEYEATGSMDDCLKPLLEYESKLSFPDIAR